MMGWEWVRKGIVTCKSNKKQVSKSYSIICRVLSISSRSPHKRGYMRESQRVRWKTRPKKLADGDVLLGAVLEYRPLYQDQTPTTPLLNHSTLPSKIPRLLNSRSDNFFSSAKGSTDISTGY